MLLCACRFHIESDWANRTSAGRLFRGGSYGIYPSAGSIGGARWARTSVNPIGRSMPAAGGTTGILTSQRLGRRLFPKTAYTRKDSEEDIAAVRDYLFTRGSVVITPNFHQSSSDREAKGVEDLKEGVKDDFSSKIEAQRATFLSSSGMTLNQHKILLKVLGYVGNRCAKFRNYRPLLIAWDKIKEAGCTPRENVLSTFLYALSEADGSEVSEDAQVNGGECDSPVAEVIREIATFHDMMYKPTEKTLSLRVKLYVAQGDASGAEGLLDLLPVSVCLKYKVKRLQSSLYSFGLYRPDLEACHDFSVFIIFLPKSACFFIIHCSVIFLAHIE